MKLTEDNWFKLRWTVAIAMTIPAWVILLYKDEWTTWKSPGWWELSTYSAVLFWFARICCSTPLKREQK